MRHRAILLLVMLAVPACTQKMAYKGRLKPFAQNAMFPPVAGTVARGHLELDDAFYRGKRAGTLVEDIPVPVTKELLARGQERFEIYCAPCHGRLGDGQGMIVKRGFLAPPSYFSDALKKAPVGHFFDVITNGKGAMFSYADRVESRDRWAIVAYIRALQLRRNVRLEELSPEERSKLEGSSP